jgi:signal transduction histidine kinase
MKLDSQDSKSACLQRQRDVLRRDFLRANTAVALVLVAVLGLAAVAVMLGYRAARQRERVEQAEQTAHERLWQSYLAQARAERLSIRAGRRTDALTAISNAAAIRPSLALRNEALASLALADLEPEVIRPLGRTGYSGGYSFDPALEHYSVSEAPGEVSIYRMADNVLVLTLRSREAGLNPTAAATDLFFSDTGKFALVMWDDRTLVLWDWKSGRILLPLGLGGPGRRSSWPPSFSADDRWMAIVAGKHQGKVALIDLESGEVQLPPVPSSLRRLSKISPRADVLAVAVGRDVQLHDRESGELRRTISAPAEVVSLSWDGTGQQLATGCRDANVYVWDLGDGAPRSFSGHSEGPWHLTFSPDGALLASASSDGSSRLWDVRSGRTICRKTDAHISRVGPQQVACGRAGVSVGVWRIAAGPGYQLLRGTVGESAPSPIFDLSPDGRWLACAWPSAVRPGGFNLWNLQEGGPPLDIVTEGPCSLALHPTQSAVFLIDSNGLALRAIEQNATGTNGAWGIKPPVLVHLPRGFQPFQCAVSGDGQLLAVMGRDGRVMALDPATPEQFKFLEGRVAAGNIGPASSTGSGRMAVSPDGSLVAVGLMATNPSPHVWDARTGKLLRRLPVRDTTVAFSPDGRWLATGDNRTYTLWSTATWKPESRRNREGVLFSRGAMAFAQGGRMMAMARSHDEVQLVDTTTGDELATLASPDPQPLAGLRLSADGRLLAAPGPEGRIQVWNLSELRRGLAALSLDWDPSRVGAATPLPSARSAFAWTTTPRSITLFGLVSVALAAFFALLVLRRHRGLVRQYVRTEATIHERNQELERAKVELMHSQKMKALGTLAAGIAHDFNNLLSVIRMSNKLIGRATKGNADLAEEVTNIEEAVQQGKQVVASMLGYSRERPEDNGACDLDDVVEETVSLLSREFLSGIELTLALDRHAPPVNISRGRLEQILLNLVVNASEAMKGRGKLMIGARAMPLDGQREFVLRPRPAAQFVELSVTDSGPGIALEILPRIFEPFFTTKTSGAKQGTGLGLSMVYTIAEQDGLGITVDSMPGQGVIFRILVPCAPDAQFPTADAGDKRKAC